MSQNCPEYWLWSNMRQRCTDQSHPWYPEWGGRGIKVCERWNDFAAFFQDVGKRPSRRHSLDRINNDGPYEPSNVRWATMTQQANNRRSNRNVLLMGRTQTVTAWCRELSLNYQALIRRLNNGMPPQEAFELIPSMRIRKSAKLKTVLG
jgi:hypothetical protein